MAKRGSSAACAGRLLLCTRAHLGLLLRQRVVVAAADEALGGVQRIGGVRYSLREGSAPSVRRRSAPPRACRLAGMPTRRSPLSEKATMDGVVRAPSEFSITLADCRGARAGAGSPRCQKLARLGGARSATSRTLPSITATQLLVVPRSIPMTSLPFALRAWWRPPAREARQRASSSSRGGRGSLGLAHHGSAAPGPTNRAPPSDARPRVTPERTHCMAKRRARVADGGGTGAEQATTQLIAEHCPDGRNAGSAARAASAKATREPLGRRTRRTVRQYRRADFHFASMRPPRAPRFSGTRSTRHRREPRD